MGTTLHEPDTTDRPLSHSDPKSDLPGSGRGQGAAPAPDQDESPIEAFDEEGAGIAAKE